MRGGDDFSLRASSPPSDDDSDDDGGSSSSLQQKRRAATSTLAESWRLYIMQIPRMSERTAICIARAYHSFHALWSAYSQCATDKQRETLVQVRAHAHAHTHAAGTTRTLADEDEALL